MKYLLIICLLVAVLITAGCVGENKNTFVTPTQTTITTTVPTTVPLDPIIGTWSYTESDGDIFSYTFFSNGNFYLAHSKNPTDTSHAIWVKTRNNEYLVTFDDKKFVTFFYDQQTDTTHTSFKPEVNTYRQGIESTQKPTLAPGSTISSIETQSGLLKLSGYGDDVQSFTITGSGLRIFTMSYKGDRNFAVVLKDKNGEWVALLANEIGTYSGKKSERMGPGTYYIDVTASGPWSVTLTSE